MPILGALVSGHDPLTWSPGCSSRRPPSCCTHAAGLAAAGDRRAGERFAPGLHPLRIRDGSTVFAGVLAGLAGAYLSIGVVGLFNEGITGGRGFIALAAFYFGRNNPG